MASPQVLAEQYKQKYATLAKRKASDLPDFAPLKGGTLSADVAAKSLRAKPDFLKRIEDALTVDPDEEESDGYFNLLDYYEQSLQRHLSDKPNDARAKQLVQKVQGRLDPIARKKHDAAKIAEQDSRTSPATISRSKRRAFDARNVLDKGVNLVGEGLLQVASTPVGIAATLGVPKAHEALSFFHNENLPDDLSFWEQAASMGGQIAGTVATGGAAGVGRIPGFINFAAREASMNLGSNYDSMRKQGYSHKKAQAQAGKAFLVDLVAGSVLNKFGEFAPGKGSVTKVLMGVPSESLEEVQQLYSQKWAAGQSPTDDEVLTAAGLGGLGGGVFGGVSGVGEDVRSAQSKRGEKRKGVEAALADVLFKTPERGSMQASKAPPRTQIVPRTTFMPVDTFAAVRDKPQQRQTYSTVDVGTPRKVSIPNSRQLYDVQPQIMEMRELIPSHDPQGNSDLRWSLGAIMGSEGEAATQMRDRGSPVAVARNNERASNLDVFALLGEHLTVTDGAPYVLPSGEVVQGNGRAATIMEAAANWPEQYEIYREALIAQHPEAANFEHPVLVNNLGDLGTLDIQAIGMLGNTTVTEKFNPAEQAFQDVTFLPKDLASRFEPGSGDLANQLNSDRNLPLTREFLESVPESERASISETHGGINEAGRKRMASAIGAAAAGPGMRDSLVNQMVDKEGPGERIVQGFGYAASDLLKIRELANSSEEAAGIAKEYQKVLGEAIKQIEKARADGFTGKDLVAFFEQGQMMSDIDPIVMKFGKAIVEVAGSAPKVGELLSATSKAVLDSGGGLFGEETSFATIEESLEAALAPFVSQNVGEVVKEAAAPEVEVSDTTEAASPAKPVDTGTDIPKAGGEAKTFTDTDEGKAAASTAVANGEFRDGDTFVIGTSRFEVSDGGHRGWMYGYVGSTVERPHVPYKAPEYTADDIADEIASIDEQIKDLQDDLSSDDIDDDDAAGIRQQIKDLKAEQKEWRSTPPVKEDVAPEPKSKLSEAAEKAEAEARAAFEKLAKKGLQSNPFDPDVLDYARKWIKAELLKGAVTVDTFVKHFVEVVKMKAEDARRLWEQVHSTTEEDDIEAEWQEATSNSRAEAHRKQIPIDDTDVEKQIDVFAETKRRKLGTKEAVARTLKKYAAGGRLDTPEEAGLSVRLATISKEKRTARKAGDTAKVAELSAEEHKIHQHTLKPEGRLIAIKAALVLSNYTPEGIVSAIERIKGRPLTEEEAKPWETMGEELESAAGDVEAAEKKIEGEPQLPAGSPLIDVLIEKIQIAKVKRGNIDDALLQEAENEWERFWRLAGIWSTEIRLWKPTARLIDATSNLQQLIFNAATSIVEVPASNALLLVSESAAAQKGTQAWMGENTFVTMLKNDSKIGAIPLAARLELAKRWKLDTKNEVKNVDFGFAKSGLEEKPLSLPKGAVGIRTAVALDAPFKMYHFLTFAGRLAAKVSKKTGLPFLHVLDAIREPNIVTAMDAIFNPPATMPMPGNELGSRPALLSFAEARRLHKAASEYANLNTFNNENWASVTQEWARKAIRTNMATPMQAPAIFVLGRFTQFSRVLANLADQAGQYAVPEYALVRSLSQAYRNNGVLALEAEVRATRAVQMLIRGGIGVFLQLLGRWWREDETKKGGKRISQAKIGDFGKDSWFKGIPIGPVIVEGINKEGEPTGQNYQDEGKLAQLGGAMTQFMLGYRMEQIEEAYATEAISERQREGLLYELSYSFLSDNPIASNVGKGIKSFDKNSSDRSSWAWQMLSAVYWPGEIGEWARIQDQQQGIYGRRGEGFFGEIQERTPSGLGLPNRQKLPVKGVKDFE